jgi:hypothetical protein
MYVVSRRMRTSSHSSPLHLCLNPPMPCLAPHCALSMQVSGTRTVRGAKRTSPAMGSAMALCVDAIGAGPDQTAALWSWCHWRTAVEASEMGMGNAAMVRGSSLHVLDTAPRSCLGHIHNAAVPLCLLQVCSGQTLPAAGIPTHQSIDWASAVAAIWMHVACATGPQSRWMRFNGKTLSLWWLHSGLLCMLVFEPHHWLPLFRFLVCDGGRSWDMGRCCNTPLTAAGICCDHGVVDDCGVCGGDNRCDFIARLTLR